MGILHSLNGEVYHYRDKDGLECDAMIHLRNGTSVFLRIGLKLFRMADFLLYEKDTGVVIECFDFDAITGESLSA